MEVQSYKGPVLVPEVSPEDAPEMRGLRTLDMSRAISGPGFPLDAASTFVRNSTVVGLLHPYGRDKTDARRNFLYRADQAVIAAVLRRMTEGGLGSPEARLAMSNALHMWREEDHPGPDAPRSPAMLTLQAYLIGQTGYFAHLATYMDPANGRFQFVACVRHQPSDTGTNWTLWNDRMELRATWLVGMTPLLAHLTRGLERLH